MTAKQAKSAERDSNKKRRQKGARGARRDQQQRQKKHEQARQEQAARDRERSRVKRSAEEEKALALQIGQIVSSNLVEGKTGGRRRWYFVSRQGRVPCMELNDGAAGQLESGAAAIVESPDGRVSLVTAAGARRIDELDDRWLVHWKRS